MSLRRVIQAAFALSALILILVPGPFPCPAHAENKALGLVLNKENGRTRCAITLKTRPLFLLKDLGGPGIQLLLKETRASDAFREDSAVHASLLRIDSRELERDILMRFILPGPLSQMSASWSTGEQTLYLDFVHGDKGAVQHDQEPYESILRQVRFGFLDMRTRMALTLNQGTAWELSQPSDDRARLRLLSVKTQLQERRFGPANNLALADLSLNGDTADIQVKLLTRIERVHLFWTEEGTHLVTDFFEGEIPPESGEVETKVAVNEKPALPSVSVDATSHSSKEDVDISEVPGQVNPDIFPYYASESEGPVFRGRIAPGGDSAHPGAEKKAPKGESSSSTENTEYALPGHMYNEEAFLYGRIRRSLEEKDYETTTKLSKKFLNKYPGSPNVEKVAFLRGDAEFGLLKGGDKDRFSPMMREYRNAISGFSGSPRIPKAYLNMARAGSLAGNNYAAIGYLNMVLKNANDHETLAEAHLERGRVYLDLNRPDNAVEDFKSVLKGYPETPQALEARIGVARYYQALGVHDKARETLEQLARDYPELHLDHPEVLLLRGANALYVNQYDKAREFLFRALNIGGQSEGSDLLLARIGDTYHHADMPREAEVFYRAVIRDYPDSEGAAISKLRLAGYDSGYRAFRDLLEDDTNKPLADLASIEMAKKLYEDGRYISAMEALDALMDRPFQDEIKREAEGIYFRAAEQEMLRLHKAGEARALVDFFLTRLNRLQRNIDPETILLAGLALQELGRHRQSVDLLETIRAYDLSQASKGERILAMVEGLLESREEDKALALLEKKEDWALLTPTDRHRLDYKLARLYVSRGRSADAYELFEDLIRRERLLMNNEIASIYLEMGRIAARERNPEEARSLLNRCIGIVEQSEEQRPILRQAYSELGTAYFLEGRYGKALDAFNKSVEQGLSPEDKGFLEMRLNMAQAYLETGDQVKAEPILEELSQEGDVIMQQRARIRLGRLGLDRQLKRISMGSNGSQ